MGALAKERMRWEKNNPSSVLAVLMAGVLVAYQMSNRHLTIVCGVLFVSGAMRRGLLHALLVDALP
jgi:hypothetical protein